MLSLGVFISHSISFSLVLHRSVSERPDFNFSTYRFCKSDSCTRRHCFFFSVFVAVSNNIPLLYTHIHRFQMAFTNRANKWKEHEHKWQNGQRRHNYTPIYFTVSHFSRMSEGDGEKANKLWYSDNCVCVCKMQLLETLASEKDTHTHIHTTTDQTSSFSLLSSLAAAQTGHREIELY